MQHVRQELLDSLVGPIRIQGLTLTRADLGSIPGETQQCNPEQRIARCVLQNLLEPKLRSV